MTTYIITIHCAKSFYRFYDKRKTSWMSSLAGMDTLIFYLPSTFIGSTLTSGHSIPSSFTEPEFFLDVVLVWSIASLFRYKVGLINQIRSSLAITILYMYRTNFTYGVWFWSENWCILVSFHCSTCEGWYYILAITNLITLLSITIKQYGVGVFMV